MVRNTLGRTLLFIAVAACSASIANALTPADWAYPIDSPAAGAQPAADAATSLRLPDSTATFTRAQLLDPFATPDWRPDEHPAMPAIVASGRKPDVMACGFCHLPTGNGRPENAALAGLPRDYIIAQMQYFRDGSRSTSVADREPTALMIALAKASSDAEIAAAADYFSALPRQSFVRVVETDAVPKMRVAGWIYTPAAGTETEPLGSRIVETADDIERFGRRDSRTTYVAYAPPGSIARGEKAARSWGEGAYACGNCHGSNFEGMDAVPPLAGKSPTYLARQLHDFKTGARRGADADLMLPVVEEMGNEDIVAIAAYLASRKPD